MENTMTGDYREVMKLSNQLCFTLYAAARKVTALYTPFLSELNLTYTQYLDRKSTRLNSSHSV